MRKILCQNFNLDETRAKLNIWKLVLSQRLLKLLVLNDIFVMQYRRKHEGNGCLPFLKKMVLSRNFSISWNTIKEWNGKEPCKILSCLKIYERKYQSTKNVSQIPPCEELTAYAANYNRAICGQNNKYLYINLLPTYYTARYHSKTYKCMKLFTPHFTCNENYLYLYKWEKWRSDSLRNLPKCLDYKFSFNAMIMSCKKINYDPNVSFRNLLNRKEFIAWN